MQRLIAAAATAALIALVTLAACSSGDDTGDESSPTATLSPAATATGEVTSSPSSKPTSSPTPAPASSATTFGDGVYVVGSDIAPGTYRNSDSSAVCFWERLSGFSDELVDTITNRLTSTRTVVTIAASDAGFSALDCGTWSDDLSAITASPTDPFGKGVYIVGTDIAPGTWRNDDSSAFCFWERLSGFSRELDDTITNGLSDELEIVTIAASDAGFSSRDCGTWSKID